MKTIVIDGQGGRIGSLLVEKLKASGIAMEIIAIGTNSIATASMLRAGADAGATGENPVIVSCREADFIMGPIGIIAADSLLGEVTPAMACAVAASRAEKILLPVSKCSLHVAGGKSLTVPALITEAVSLLQSLSAL